MSKLLAAGFSRLFKKKTFYIAVLIMAVNGILISVTGYLDDRSGFPTSLDDNFFEYVPFVVILMSVFCAMFIGTEYSDGTMRNKVIVGHKRSVIYLSNYIVSAAAGLMMCAAFFVTDLGLGIPLLGFFAGDFGMIMALVGCSAALLLAVTGIFTLISIIIRSKSASAVISIILAFALIMAAGILYNLLALPEYVPNYVEFDSVYFDAEGETVDAADLAYQIPVGEPEMMPHPLYVGGVKRQVYQFIVDFTPGGQAVLIAGKDVSNPLLLVGYSLIIAVVTTAVGLFVFNKKNLN